MQFRQPRSQQASKCSAVTNGPLARMCALPNAILISRLSSTYYRGTLMGGMLKISLRGSTPPRSCIRAPSRAPSTRCDETRGDASASRSCIQENAIRSNSNQEIFPYILYKNKTMLKRDTIFVLRNIKIYIEMLHF